MLAYSFVVPVYNDAYLAEAFCNELERVMQIYLNADNVANDLELIFVDDGSTEENYSTLLETASRYSFVSVIRLSRNFGQHVAIACGYHHCSGAYVGRLNIDMEDPPSSIPLLLQSIRNSEADIVIGIKEKRYSKRLDVITSRLFFYLFSFLLGMHLESNTASLRVMTRRYANNFKRVNDHFPFLQGLEAWFGYKTKYINIESRDRVDNRTSYTFKKRLKLALYASISFSDRPLKLAIYLGLFLAICGFMASAALILRRLVYPDMVPGFASIATLIIFFSGVQLFVTGMVGFYVGRILVQVQGRPLYLIRDSYNLNRIGNEDS